MAGMSLPEVERRMALLGQGQCSWFLLPVFSALPSSRAGLLQEAGLVLTQVGLKDGPPDWVNDEAGAGHLGTSRPSFLFFLTEVWLIYNVVLVSGVQQSDSVIYIYIYIYIYLFI